MRDDDVEVGPLDAARLRARDGEAEARHAERRERPLERVEGNAEVERRGEEHVAGDAADRLQVEDVHAAEVTRAR